MKGEVKREVRVRGRVKGGVRLKGTGQVGQGKVR